MAFPARPAHRHVLPDPLPVQRVPGADSPPHLIGFVRNVSRTGMFLQCPLPPPVGTRMSLRLRLPGEAQELVVERSQVMWVREFERAEPRPAGMGLRLIGMDPRNEQVWRRFCRKLSPGVDPHDRLA